MSREPAVEYDETGGRFRLRVKVGDPITKTWSVTIGGSAANFSGATGSGAIRTGEDLGTTAVASLTVTFPTSSTVKIVYTGADIPVGSYWLAFKVVMADGTVYRGQGPLVVEPAGV